MGFSASRRRRMVTSKEVQEQLNRYLQGEGREPDSPVTDHGLIPPCPEPQDEPRDHLLKAPGEKIASKTWRFHSLKDLWRKVIGK